MTNPLNMNVPVFVPMSLDHAFLLEGAPPRHIQAEKELEAVERAIAVVDRVN